MADELNPGSGPRRYGLATIRDAINMLQAPANDEHGLKSAVTDARWRKYLLKMVQTIEDRRKRHFSLLSFVKERREGVADPEVFLREIFISGADTEAFLHDVFREYCDCSKRGFNEVFKNIKSSGYGGGSAIWDTAHSERSAMLYLWKQWQGEDFSGVSRLVIMVYNIFAPCPKCRQFLKGKFYMKTVTDSEGISTEFCGQEEDGKQYFGIDFATLLAEKFQCPVTIIVRSPDKKGDFTITSGRTLRIRDAKQKPDTTVRSRTVSSQRPRKRPGIPRAPYIGHPWPQPR